MRLALLALLAAGAVTRTGCGDLETLADAYRPCAAKSCGEPCTACPPGATDCAETMEMKVCGADGRCGGGDPACPPHPDCVGKVCGDGCNPCMPAAACPTFMPSACDPRGQCSGAVAGLCDECGGKTCGTPCHPPSCAFGAPCLEPGYCNGDGLCTATGAVPQCGVP